LTQQVSSPPEQTPERISRPLSTRGPRFSRPGIISLLVLVGLLLLLFTGLVVRNVPQVIKPPVKKSVTPQYVASPTAVPVTDVLQLPGKVEHSALQVPAGQYIVYEQQNKIYSLSTSGGVPHIINTPGYIYNRSVSPLVTSTGQLLYSGNGLWLADIFGGSSRQIAKLPSKQVITSLVVSRDGTHVAWSTEPTDGYGNVTIYAGPLEHSLPVYQRTVNACPCFRVFSFMNDQAKHSNTTLLLADDRGDHHAVQYGLWSFDLTKKPAQEPRQLLSEVEPAGPLALASASNTLLYSMYEGFVPAPTDGSVPDDATSITYANSLSMATVSGNPPSLGSAQVVLPEQHELSNSAEYRWVTTPLFSPDGHTLLYVEFSSDDEDPYTRRSALYTVQLSQTNGQLQIGKPQVLATTTAHFMELGVWLNPHVVTFYADGNIYALDTSTGAGATLANITSSAAKSANIGTYARIVAVVSQGPH
jgi:hypothetical protein